MLRAAGWLRNLHLYDWLHSSQGFLLFPHACTDPCLVFQHLSQAILSESPLLAFAASALLLPAKSAASSPANVPPHFLLHISVHPDLQSGLSETFSGIFRDPEGFRNRPGSCNRKVPTDPSRGSFPRRTDVVLRPPDQNWFHAEATDHHSHR